jgi:dolichol kinase
LPGRRDSLCTSTGSLGCLGPATWCTLNARSGSDRRYSERVDHRVPISTRFHAHPAAPRVAIRALSALVTSRRNLVQLFTLCSFVLLVHLAWSLRLEVRLIKRASQPPETPASSTMERDSSEPRHATGGSSAMSSSPNPTAVSGTYWLRRGEWRRTKSVVGFSFLVTGGCVVVKIVTALIGRGVWSGES